MTDTKLSTAAEELQELDFIFKSGSDLDVVERGYGRKLVHAISGQNTVLEREALKSLGDVYLHKANKSTGKAENFNKACSLYAELLRYYTSLEEKEVVQHRIRYAEKLALHHRTVKVPVSNSGNSTSAVWTTLNKAKTKFKGYGTTPLIKGYTDSFVNGIIERNELLKIESLKSLGDLYLEKGRVDKDETVFSKSAGLYRAALDRCEDSGGRETLQHRIKYAENLDLDRAERKFAAALQAVHVRGQHWKEVEPLCKLSEVYLKRGMLSKVGGDFTKAAALSNAALIRARAEDQEGIKQSIQKVTHLFVKHVIGIEKTVPIDDDVEKHKSVLMEHRGYAENEIKRIDQHVDPFNLDKDDPNIGDMEKKRAEAIKAMFDTIVHQRKTFIIGLVDECIVVMGPPPCKYAMIGLGSHATGLVTPYSDLEFAILIEKETESIVNYFHHLTHYLHLKVINLGETILPAMAIKSLNNFESVNKLDDWFYDSVTPRGFSFDGAMPHACKTPLGRGKNSLLIRTPRDMVRVLEDDISLYRKKGYHLATVLGNVSLITGEQDLVDEYIAMWDHRIQENEKNVARLLANTMLTENAEMFERQNPTDKMLDVKKEIYRFSSLAVSCWALLAGIQPTTIWETIEKMRKEGAISDESKHHLMVLVSISAELRLRTYMNNHGQVENMSALSSMPTTSGFEQISKKVFYVSNSKQLMRYYYTAIPLKNSLQFLQDDSRQSLQSITLFDDSLKVQAEVYLSLCDYQNYKTYTEQALHKELLKNGKTATNLDIASLLVKLGNACFHIAGYKEEVIYLVQALQMYKSIYGESTAHSDIAKSLSNLGTAWSNLGNHSMAIDYYKQALQMHMSIYGDKTAPRHIAGLINNMGNSWSVLGDYRNAVSCHEKALSMIRLTYGESTVHPDIATSLNNLGNAWIELRNNRKAVVYFEQSLQMRRDIYGESTAHLGIAYSLNNLGLARDNLGDHRKAIRCHEMSLQMKRSIYGEGIAHLDIAYSLNNLGICWTKLNDCRRAISYYEMSLQMKWRIYGAHTPHFDIANSLNNMGMAWKHIGDHRKAIEYFEQALEMRRSINGKDAVDSYIAELLYNLGNAWGHICDYRKAISYLEQARQMMMRIHGKSNAYPVTNEKDD
ncbi:uncharacterized protein LOC144908776 [Branchiostoma floridae x Branchiostoma belcheri]